MPFFDPQCRAAAACSENSEGGHPSERRCQDAHNCTSRADIRYRDIADSPYSDHEPQSEPQSTAHSPSSPKTSKLLVDLSEETTNAAPIFQASVVAPTIAYSRDTSNYITEDEAAKNAIRCLQRQKKELLGRILTSKLTRSESVDLEVLKTIVISSNVAVFDNKLCGNQCWVSDPENPNTDQYTLATTSCRRLLDGSVETRVSLSTPISLSGDLHVTLKSFLRELIHAYLFVCCGPEATSCSAAFLRIAEALDAWLEDPLLRLKSVENDFDLSATMVADDASKKEAAVLSQRDLSSRDCTNSHEKQKLLVQNYDNLEPITHKEYRFPSPLSCISEKLYSEKQLVWQTSTSTCPARPFLESIYEAVDSVTWNICICFHGDDERF